ncbi:hypothetical protein PAHAL_5G419300 [Panicum hallii]|jgi:hypothetical protein|uniref:C2 domain-containing protein n=1 Tax=Panicum hallii TaxID=206008 RepID=A0A2S3HWG8_9POAL|nr:protein SRC2 homolog [Panicum hallii]PAN31431.1 hypothetical protein PAHAL_5G419300 [Panicum hallii]
MGSRYEVEVTVGSGQDLKNVNWRNGDLKPYVVLWVDDGPKCSTGVDNHDGENPEWRDEKLVVRLPPSATRLEDAVLHVDVVHANAAAGTKPLVGSARLPLRDVLDGAGIGSKVSRTLRLKRPSGRPQGKLDIRVAVREAARYHDPSPYPAPYGHPAGSGSKDPYHAAPPPPPYYGQPPVGYPAYGAPSAPAYAAAAPVVVVPAAAAAAQQKGSNKMGMGTGLAVGAAAGVLGGLAIAGGASYLGERFDHDCCDSDDDY